MTIVEWVARFGIFATSFVMVLTFMWTIETAWKLLTRVGKKAVQCLRKPVETYDR